MMCSYKSSFLMNWTKKSVVDLHLPDIGSLLPEACLQNSDEAGLALIFFEIEVRYPEDTTTKPNEHPDFGARSTSVQLAPKNVMDLRKNPGYSNVDIFTYNEMRIATRNFRPDQILGEGGFGIVYKGVIDENVKEGYKSTQVAIKVLDPEGYQGDREWLVFQLCAVKLYIDETLGVCLTMPWSTRMKIALGAAKGLAFLHGAERPIIYRDFKTSNILLDADYNAKLSDFGLAKDGPMGDQTHVSTRVIGTYGYAAPEYVMTGHLTARSDVYGFGVVLLEMLIGRKALDKSRPSREHNLVEWAHPILNHNKKLLRILDQRMDGQYSVKVAQKVANLAYQCLSQNPKGRPMMSQVVEILEEFQTTTDDAQSGGGIVTLYELPKSNPDDISQETRTPQKTGRERVHNAHHKQQDRTARGRSKSETPNEQDLYSPSPDFVAPVRKSSLP
ncbi:hypothetical protein Syun_024710 [Stephania yunnanensis]|uniref:Protein kinase domain-containing protein n=1 Tax=Stephania yunnanensis TaxID=152371 RepID=A0AAP0HVJ9_9MAGN